MIINLSMMNSVIMFIGLFGTANYFARLANYFLIFQCLALPMILQQFTASSERQLRFLSVAGFLAYFYYDEVLANHLKATDSTAMTLAMDNNMTLVCFGLSEENSIIRVVRGEEIGTTVKNSFEEE